MNVINSIQTKLDTARAELLDQSLRNPLINYRLSRTRGVEVVDESPPDIYRILVQDGKAMSFLPKPEPEEDDNFQLFEDDEMEKDPARYTDSRLQTDYSSVEFQRRLLYYTARTAIEEQGVNTLYLVLGMLQWYESESSNILRRAPLILIPVEISRTSVRTSVRISYTEEDIGTNLSLQEKFKSEFGIQFPALPDADDLEQSNIQSYYQKVNSAICHKPRWGIDESAIVLGFFSFAKFLMYRDLDIANWSSNALSEHSVLHSLLTSGFHEPRSAIDPNTSNIDEYLNPVETHHVVDADSSQALAIHDVSQGRNLVIQGPPGTGKSQTITNLIAEAISKGKRVLFVAEKMAALEVVKRNLDKVGLGDACLELHSHKMNKKAVVDELKRTLELGEPQTTILEEEVRLLLNDRGVAALKRYLKYAETGRTDIAIPTGGEADSPFEEEVAAALRGLDYQVDHQIGSAGYFIDLGVKDPERPGRYLLGIECDGATYHSAQSARDRDRLRQQVLEGLGWRIHRIWSTDWFRTPDRELGKAAEAIEAAKVRVPPSESPPENNSPDSDEGEAGSESEPDMPAMPRKPLKYKLAEPIISTNGLDLHAVPSSAMANWVQGIVKIESPVHFDEVARRIAAAVGVAKIGSRIQSKVKTAARQAARSGSVQIREGFLYWTEQEEVTVRDRGGLPNVSRKIELIAPEEIEVAIKQVVSDAFGIGREDLALEVPKLFGIKRATANIQQGVDKVVERLIKDGRLILQGDSLVIP